MKTFTQITNNWNLGKKLTILMFIIFLVGAIVSSFVYYNVLLVKAQEELNRQSSLIISTMDSIRKYNQDNINPLLEKQSEDNFLPESIPSFALRNVFDILTTTYKDKYGEYSYKDAMINPTNLKDEATYEEIMIIAKLKEQDKLPGENITQGFLKINGMEKFYTARPIKITDSSCLSCHTSLKESPKSLQALYEIGEYIGNQGFGWELDKVIGTKIVYIPAEVVYENTKRDFILILGIFMAIFAVAILLVNIWLKQYVSQPLKRITKVAQALSLGDTTVDFDKESNDEIGHLAEAFTRMKTSLQIAMTRLSNKTSNNQD